MQAISQGKHRRLLKLLQGSLGRILALKCCSSGSNQHFAQLFVSFISTFSTGAAGTFSEGLCTCSYPMLVLGTGQTLTCYPRQVNSAAQGLTKPDLQQQLQHLSYRGRLTTGSQGGVFIAETSLFSYFSSLPPPTSSLCLRQS